MSVAIEVGYVIFQIIVIYIQILNITLHRLFLDMKSAYKNLYVNINNNEKCAFDK